MGKWAIHIQNYGGKFCLGPVTSIKNGHTEWVKHYSIHSLEGDFSYGDNSNGSASPLVFKNKSYCIKFAFLYNKQFLDECVAHRERYENKD